MTELQHPDVARAQRTGWPWGAEQENRDRPEYRLEYARERAGAFIDFALAGDPDIVDAFVEHFGWDYRHWLN